MVPMMIVPNNEISNQNNNAGVGAADADADDSMIPVTFTNNVPAPAPVPAAQINPLDLDDLDQNQKKMKMMKIKTTTRAKNKLKRYNNHHNSSSSWISITTIMMIIITIIILVEMLSMAQAEFCRASFNTSHFFDCPKMFIDAPTKTWCCGGNTDKPRCCEWSEREKETKNSKHRWTFDNIVTFFMLKLVLSIIVSLAVYFIYIKVKICCQILCEDDDDDSGTTTFVRPARLSRTTTTSIHRRSGMANNTAGSNGSLGNGRTSAHFHQNRRLPSAQTHLPRVDEDAPVEECSLMIDECGIMLENDNPPSYSEAIATSTTVNFDGNAVNFSNTPTATTSYDPPPSISSTATTNSVGRSSSIPSVALENNGTPTTDGMGGANSQQNSSRPITGQDGQDDQHQPEPEQQHPPTPPPSYNMGEEEEVQVAVGKTQPPYNPEYADDMV